MPQIGYALSSEEHALTDWFPVLGWQRKQVSLLP
jgi:hypothetical protein